MQSSFRAEVLRSWEAAAPRWQRLQERGFGTPFQQTHWLQTWYRTFGALAGISPVLVAATNDAGEDALLIPLIRRAGGLLSTIEFADQWTTDYNAPLIGPAAPNDAASADALWRAVVAALPRADRIRFTKMPVEVRGRSNPLTLLRGCRRSETRGYIVDLPERWDDYQASLKKDVRSLLRRRWDKLIKDTNAKLRWVDDPEEGRRILAILQQQQKTRLDDLGARHVFDQPAHRQFYERHVVDGLKPGGGAVLTAIVAGDDVIATFLGVTDGHRCTLIRSSQLWSEKWMRYGLGKLIIERSMQALHERGHRQFDLSIGDFAYKHDFGVRPVEMLDLDVACSWRALPSIARDHTWQRLRKNRYAASLARSARKFLSFRDPRATQAS